MARSSRPVQCDTARPLQRNHSSNSAKPPCSRSKCALKYGDGRRRGGVQPGNSQHSSIASLLRHSKKIVLITGAGISTNAGISDFRSTARTKRSSRTLLDVSALCSEKSIAQFYDFATKMFQQTCKLQPTAFHHFIDNLAKLGRLQRHYTQNIDCLHGKLPALSQRTVQLHGRLDTVICQRCSHTQTVEPESYAETLGSSCSSCKACSWERKKAGKRGLSVGVLRPKILLYGEANPDETFISTACGEDLSTDVDAVIVAGTRLLAPTVREFARRLCRNVKSRNGVTLWISKERPASSVTAKLFDHVLLGDCDTFLS